MTSDFAHMLKSLREAAGLSLDALARRANMSKSYLGNIERGRRLPSAEVASNLDRVLSSGNTLTLIARHSRATGVRLSEYVNPTGHGIDRLFGLAVQEAEDAVTLIASTSDGDHDVLGQLASLAQRYQAEDRVSAFVQARELATQANHRIIYLRRTTQIRDQQLAASLSYALMSSIAFDLCRWRDARVLAHAAVNLAELAGHSEAIAWARGMQATLANWQGRPTMAIQFADAGIAILQPGPARLRLLHIQARSHALQGNRVALATKLHKAETDRESARNDEIQALGGEFVFGEARAAACVATAWLDAGDPRLAETASRRSLALYGASRPEHPASPFNGATIDLVAALLLQERMSEALELLRPIINMASAGTALDGRINRVQAILDSPQWIGDSQAHELSAALTAIGRKDG